MEPPAWQISPVDLRLAGQLSAELGVSRVVGEILARRGFLDADTAQDFLHPDYRLHDPYLMPGIASARKRVDRALARGEAITIHGDYDADGITAAYLLSEVLRDLGGDVTWRLPNRFSDGYGLAAETVEELAAVGTGLLITVDCGVTALTEVARARELGMDVIVTDHHQHRDELPGCIVVSPKLGSYPFPHLAGVGVALKLAHALLQDPAGGQRVELPLSLRPFVDVVALGTVADIVPLRDENRALVAMGIGRLRGGPRPGLAALLEVSGTDAAAVSAGTIGFRLAPRINAAGRLEDASLAMELLAAGDREAALPVALKLNELNAVRQELEAAMVKEALGMITEPLPPALVLSSPDWHEGVVGIVASRVVEEVGRPAILLSEGDGEAKGSGRSIPAFDLLAAVDACADSLLSYGGHRAACGVRLRLGDVPRFRAAFVDLAAHTLRPSDLVRRAAVDAVCCGDELTLGLADELALLEPHGFENPRPRLLLRGAHLRSCRRTRDGRHLQCQVAADGTSAAGIRFRHDGEADPIAGSRYDVALRLNRNSYNALVSAQLEVLDFIPWVEPAVDLCPTPCTLECARRVSGEAFWRLLDELALESGDDQGAATLAEGLRREGRLFDLRGRPLVSVVSSILAAGGRALVLVADVGRRRPLLTRELLAPGLGRAGMYLSGACAGARLPLALGHADRLGDERLETPPDTVMCGAHTAAAHPELTAAARHLIFVDPPSQAAALNSVLAAADEEALVHFVWGPGEVQFAQKVAAAAYDLDAELRRVYRVLARSSGMPLDGRLERELLGPGPFLAKLPSVAAAYRTLREVGLVAQEEGKNLVREAKAKVDLTTAPTYRAWQRRSQSTSLL